MATAAAFYGVVDYAFKPRGKSASIANRSSSITATMTTVANEIAQDATAEAAVATILNAVMTSWDKNPFLPGSTAETYRKTPDKAATHLLINPGKYVYSGYAALGEERIAIINGLDYKTGEKIDGFLVQEISLDTVLLNKDSHTFIIPFKETE